MQFYIYSRKSVATDRGESVENQVELCRRYVFEKFPGAGEEDLRIYEDEGFSAKNTDRPRFQAMLRDLRRERPDFVVCYRLDRVSRSVSDFSTLIEEFHQRGVAFLCIREEFDTSKPMGKAMMYIASVFAQLERETIAERVRDNMLLLARTGRWLGGTTPTGYTSEQVQEIYVDGRRKTVCRLREEPEEIRTVDLIYDKFLELESVAGVCKYLLRAGLRSRMGGEWSPLGVKEILKNPVYCAADPESLAYFQCAGAEVCFGPEDFQAGVGLLAYNKRDYKKKSAPRREMEEWVVAAGRHRGRISGDRWVRVQGLLDRREGAAPRQRNEYAFLSGLIRCGFCGGPMFAKHRSGGRQGFDYLCARKLKGGAGACPCPNLNGPEADRLVWTRAAATVSEDPTAALEELRRTLKRSMQHEPDRGPGPGLRRCREETERLTDLLAREELGGAALRQIGARLQALEEERLRLEARNGEKGDRIGQERLEHLLGNGGALLADLSPQERKVWLRQRLERLEWDGEELRVFFK